MTDIVLHIGLLKTASTTLQMQYFPECSELNYIHRSTVPELGHFINYVTNTSPCYFDKTISTDILSRYLDSSKLNLISAENLSGQLLAAVGTPGLDFRHQILNNLAGTYENARILIVIRRQDKYAQSIYREYLRQGGTERIDRFFNVHKTKRPSILSIDSFLFKKYIDCIYRLFPKGVLVLTFEEFVEDQPKFITKMNKFMGINPGEIYLKKSNDTRLGHVGLELTRLFNRIFRSALNPAGLIPGVPVRRGGVYGMVSPIKIVHNRWPFKGTISDNSKLHKTAIDILQACKNDNRELDEAYSLDLKKYGYW